MNVSAIKLNETFPSKPAAIKNGLTTELTNRNLYTVTEIQIELNFSLLGAL